MADAFEVSLDYMVGTSEKQINKEMLNRIEEADKMNRAGEFPLINANTLLRRALSDRFIQIILRQTRKKKS